MKKNLPIIIVSTICSIIAILLVYNRSYLTTLDGEAADFVVYDTANVTKIFMANLNSDEVLLERTEDQKWKLNNQYFANKSTVDQLLTTMMKMRVRTPVSKASHDNVVSRMSSNHVKVEVYQNVPRINLFNKIKLFPREKRTKSYFIGDITKDNLGTYMLKEGADKAYVMHLPNFRGFLSTRFSPKVEDWRQHTIFNNKLTDISSVKVEFNEEPVNSFEIKQLGKHKYSMTRLFNQMPVNGFDTIRVLNFLASFDDIRFETVMNSRMPKPTQDSIIHSPFLHRITLTTTDGKENVVTTYKKWTNVGSLGIVPESVGYDADRMYALINNNSDFVLIQYYVFDKLIRPITYYHSEK